MSRADDIVEAYEAWDPDNESATELAERLGISKARLYQVLEREGVTPKARRPPRRDRGHRVVAARMSEPTASPSDDGALLGKMAEQTLELLLYEVTELRRQLAEYRKRYGPLE